MIAPTRMILIALRGTVSRRSSHPRLKIHHSAVIYRKAFDWHPVFVLTRMSSHSVLQVDASTASAQCQMGDLLLLVLVIDQ